MNETLLELMHPARVVVVRMGGDCDDFAVLKEVFGSRSKAGDSQPGIDEQVAVAPPHMPEIGTDEGVRVGLGDVGETVIYAPDLEPGISNPHYRAGICIPVLPI